VKHGSKAAKHEMKLSGIVTAGDLADSGWCVATPTLISSGSPFNLWPLISRERAKSGAYKTAEVEARAHLKNA
jgi:hypothetical protein